MPFVRQANGLLLHDNNYTDEDMAAIVKSSCGAPQVAMRHPVHPVSVVEEKDQAQTQEEDSAQSVLESRQYPSDE